MRYFIWLLTILISHNVHAFNRCAALFASNAQAQTMGEALSPFGLKKVNQITKSQYETILSMHEGFEPFTGATTHVDRDRNLWSFEPSEGNLKINEVPSKDSSEFEAFHQKVISQLQKYFYAESTLQKYKSGQHPIVEVDFFNKNEVTRFYDFNLKHRYNKALKTEWHVVENYLGFLFQIYESKLNISGDVKQLLEKISRRMLSRTTLIIKDNLTEQNERVYHMGIIAVESRSIQEQLPSEVLHNISIRKLLKIPRTKGLAEIGRFGKSENSVESTAGLTKLIVESISARKNIDYVIIEADAIRRRLWKKLGFQDIDQSQNPLQSDYYKSGTDYLMYVDVKVLQENLNR